MKLPVRPESHDDDCPSAFDAKLFTPGPLTTSLAVKQAMQHDIGAWDAPLRRLAAELHAQLLRVAGVGIDDGWECTLMQGSGTFGVESPVGSLLPRQGRFAVVSNGAYGERMLKIAGMLGLDTVAIRTQEDEQASPEQVAAVLEADRLIHTVGIIHVETTTGLANDVAGIGSVVRRFGRRFLVDAMSSFGAYPLELEAIGCDALISSANKCLEGVPGVCFVLARRRLLEAAEAGAWPRSHSLDIVDQWRGFQRTGKFRFTPPTQVLLALRRALHEFFAEGGIEARQARYQANHETLVNGMERLGFRPFVDRARMSHIITTFLCPSDPAYDFETFYAKLCERGLVIYPGKVSDRRCFRLGNIGRLYQHDMHQLLSAIAEVKAEMGFDTSAAESPSPKPKRPG